MRKIWIVGAKGHVGTALIDLIDCLKYKMFLTDADEVDVTDRNIVHKYIASTRPDVIINCAGITDIEVCEQNPERAYAVNAIGPRNLAVEAQSIGAKLIQLSTDDVFDAEQDKPYNEFDTVHPKTMYGKSKYAGERFIEDLSNRYVIVRSSWVYGTGKDFVNSVLEAIGREKVLEGPVNQYASPTSAEELAKVVTQFIDNDCFGIYHAVCRGYCSRYEFAKEIIKYSENEGKIELKAVEADYGSYSVLDNMMLRIDGLEEPCDWKTALKKHITKTGGLV